METKTYNVTYEINGLRSSLEFIVSGNIQEADLGMSAKSQIKKKHPGVKNWEIKILSIY